MSMHKISYNKPATLWQEALPLGNGSLGAMVYGNPDTELIQLNLDTLWSGEPGQEIKPDARQTISKIRQYIAAGDHVGAEALADKEYQFGRSQRYLPLGNLHIHTITGSGCAVDCNRTLNMRTAVHSVTYIRDGHKCRYYTDTFVSYPDQVMVIKHYGEAGRKTAMSVSFDSLLKTDITASQDTIYAAGMAPCQVPLGYSQNLTYDETRNALRFHVQIQAFAPGGWVETNGNQLLVFEADEVYILLSAVTNFVDYKTAPDKTLDLKGLCSDRITHARLLGYTKLLERHTEYFSSLFNRVSLKLPDDAKTELQFHFGRYLMISGSAPGSQAMNLQGIWNRDLFAPWRSNYTTNINTEMNYWPAEMCNLPECHLPLLSFVQEAAEAGEDTAHKVYGCNGTVAHHNIDLWRKTTPAAGSASWSMWPMSLSWLTAHLWEHYLYQPDEKYLREQVYPATEKCVLFYFDWLQEKNGKFITCPSTSPENVFLQGITYCSIASSSAMDLALLKDLFTRYLRMSELLKIQNVYTERANEILTGLPPFQVTDDGRLMEWDQDYPEGDPGHRHFSHLYGVYPGECIRKSGGEILEAAKRSLDVRLEKGSGYTGWSCAWVINLYAALGNGEKAYNAAQRLLRDSIYPNLMDAHPPFQIDGNFGFTAGICQMLMQSEFDGDGPVIIHILPALPKAWRVGEAKGLRAKGNIILDIRWQDETVRVHIRSAQSEYVLDSQYQIKKTR